MRSFNSLTDNSQLSPYDSREARSEREIENEICATRGHRRLQLRVELAESRLNHFCHQKMRTPRDTDYNRAYLIPKRILEAAVRRAKNELLKHEIENEL